MLLHLFSKEIILFLNANSIAFTLALARCRAFARVILKWIIITEGMQPQLYLNAII